MQDTITKDNPFELFSEWFHEANTVIKKDPNAMALATCDSSGFPSVRIVLLKQFDERGFCFFTNKTSFKGESLKQNPKASLCFYWKELDKQIRITGNVVEVEPHEADQYFASRSRESQIGAWASNQSSELNSMNDLETRYKTLVQKFDGENVPRPPFWSGYRVVPTKIEFWKAGAHRLHERVLFSKKESNWQKTRLFP